MVSLYEKIGGKAKIVPAVDLFYRKVLADERLKQFFDPVNMDQLRSLQAMFLTMLVGAKMKYTGKDIRAAHTGLSGKGLNDDQECLAGSGDRGRSGCGDHEAAGRNA